MHDRHNGNHADRSPQQYTSNNKETALSHSARKLAEASDHCSSGLEKKSYHNAAASLQCNPTVTAPVATQVKKKDVISMHAL